MATVYITFRIMPESPDVDLAAVEEKVKVLISEWGNVAKVTQQPIAFGLKAIDIIFSMDEAKGSTDDLEEKVEGMEGVQSVQVTDVRRAIG